MPNLSVTLTLKFMVIPDVNPGGDAQSFTTKVEGQAKTALAEATSTLAEKGISLTTTSGSEGEWTGLSIGTSTPDLLSEDNLTKLSNMIGKLKKATDLLVKVAKIIELVMSSFGSLASIVKTLISSVQSQVNNWIKDLSGIGVYFNMIVPPAFFPEFYHNYKLKNLSSGGFQSFVSTLGVSFNNNADKNRPIFSDDAQVGGFIILIDADTLDEFATTMTTFTRMFSFMELFPVNGNPQPPNTIKGVTKYDKDAGKWGIKLTWKGPSVYSPEYRISRSMKSGGRKSEKDVDLTRLKLYDSKDMNLFRAVKIKIQTKEWPKEPTIIYDDLEGEKLGVPSFNGPVIVGANLLTGGGSYMDYNIKLVDGRPAPLTYYYVIESGAGTATAGSWSPMSPQATVHAPPKCIDSNTAAMTENRDPRGRVTYGFISSGWQGFGKWANVKLSIPFLNDFGKIFAGILDSIAGMASNASSAFSSFLQSIKDKIDYYINMVESLIGILQSLQSLKLAGRVAYLYLPVESGGTAGFMSRLRAAKPISEGFSGPTGITAGMVFVTGIPAFDLTIDEDTLEAQDQAIALKNQTFETLVKLFMSIFGG